MASKSSLFEIGQMRGQISPIGELKATMSFGTGDHTQEYEGPYVVVPDAHYDQILETSGKKMSDNVTVTKVPFHETHNESGTTIYIAMEVQNG